jgi:hypothetical protein
VKPPFQSPDALGQGFVLLAETKTHQMAALGTIVPKNRAGNGGHTSSLRKHPAKAKIVLKSEGGYIDEDIIRPFGPEHFESQFGEGFAKPIPLSDIV